MVCVQCHVVISVRMHPESMYPMSRVEAATVAKMAFKNVPSQKLVVGQASGSHMHTYGGGNVSYNRYL